METAVRWRDQRREALTTIFARSTGALPSAIAIVRISGPGAGSALAALSKPDLPVPRQAVIRALRRPDTGDLLDRAMVLWLPAPATVTGEDMVELHLHGGRAVVAAVEGALGSLPGLVPAEPGEFTRRAFDNGRMDLSEVEGLADLLVADTERQRSSALAMAEGGLRRRVGEWQARLLLLAARVEASIDFAEEGDVDQDDLLAGDIADLAHDLRSTLAGPPAERLRDGVRVVLAGPPNSGKSTLLNALSGREAAIVSPIAGTTRDLVEAVVSFDHVPVILTDTAGLRDRAADTVEAIGVERARDMVGRADLILWLGAPGDAPSGNAIRVAAKADLVPPSAQADIAISALTGQGMDALRTIIVARAEQLLPSIGTLALSMRQRQHVSHALDALEAAKDEADEILRAEQLRVALVAFDRVTGAADVEAMLDTLFGRFCLGK